MSVDPTAGFVVPDGTAAGGRFLSFLAVPVDAGPGAAALRLSGRDAAAPDLAVVEPMLDEWFGAVQ